MDAVNDEGLRGWAARRGRARRRGAVALEAVTCLVPLMLVFLCAVQLAFLAVGRLVVTHAATRGARAAIVLLEDDPKRMRGAPRGDLNAAGGSPAARGLASGLGPAWEAVFPGVRLPGGIAIPTSGGGARLQAIREAVYAPLAAIAPAPLVYSSSGALTVYDAVGGRSRGGALARFAVGVLAYGRAAAVVTLRSAPGSPEIVTHVEPRADVTVHVTYLQHCAVPIAARLMCDPAWDLAGYGRVLAELQRLDPHRLDEAARVMRQLRARFPADDRFGELARELARAENPGLLLPLMLRGARFAVLRAEATLPNQGAAYANDAEEAATSGR